MISQKILIAQNSAWDHLKEKGHKKTKGFSNLQLFFQMKPEKPCILPHLLPSQSSNQPLPAFSAFSGFKSANWGCKSAPSVHFKPQIGPFKPQNSPSILKSILSSQSSQASELPLSKQLCLFRAVPPRGQWPMSPNRAILFLRFSIFCSPHSHSRLQFGPLRPQFGLYWPKISPLRPEIHPLRPWINPSALKPAISGLKSALSGLQLALLSLKSAFTCLSQPSLASNPLSQTSEQRSWN